MKWWLISFVLSLVIAGAGLWIANSLGSSNWSIYGEKNIFDWIGYIMFTVGALPSIYIICLMPNPSGPTKKHPKK